MGMTITEYMKKKYDNREDKENIFGVGITDAEFRKFAIDYLLGEDWYVVDPLGQTQINEIALDEILTKYSSRYKKETRKRIWGWQIGNIILKQDIRDIKDAVHNNHKIIAFLLSKLPMTENYWRCITFQYKIKKNVWSILLKVWNF